MRSNVSSYTTAVDDRRAYLGEKRVLGLRHSDIAIKPSGERQHAVLSVLDRSAHPVEARPVQGRRYRADNGLEDEAASRPRIVDVAEQSADCVVEERVFAVRLENGGKATIDSKVKLFNARQFY